MSGYYLQIRKILFTGPKNQAGLNFNSGINVICGASDTGKSFLVEAIDFMLGGSELREIPELALYAEIELYFSTSEGKNWCLTRAVTGGNFRLTNVDDRSETIILKSKHAHNSIDNLSGFLLEQIGLLNKTILRSTRGLKTQSLSFRNLAALTVIQEDEIQRKGSPFWSGQHTTKTSEIAAVKLLLTNIDDSAIVNPIPLNPSNNNDKIIVLDELMLEISDEIGNIDEDQEQLNSQLGKLEDTIKEQNEYLNTVQLQLNTFVKQRYEIFEEKDKFSKRLTEISELLPRFELLKEHYVVDIDRLHSIQESGAIFFHLESIPCPTCGNDIEPQCSNDSCNLEIEKIINSATAEIEKIHLLLNELDETVRDLSAEKEMLESSLKVVDAKYIELDQLIQQAIVPQINNFRFSFSELIEKRSNIYKNLELFSRYNRLDERKRRLLESVSLSVENPEVKTGIPESIAHALSLKVETILKAWNFPGKCHVHFDKKSADFVIDGKPRGGSGKGLRAITHAAVNVALLEYCQEHKLSHPGFLVLDSPLLAYYEPEGEDDIALSGSDLKEMFYAYLIKHHGSHSQIIIIENQHPPLDIQKEIFMTIFTSNPNEGRFGFL